MGIHSKNSKNMILYLSNGYSTANWEGTYLLLAGTWIKWYCFWSLWLSTKLAEANLGNSNMDKDTLSPLIVQLLNSNVAVGCDGSFNNVQVGNTWSLIPKHNFTSIIKGIGPIGDHTDFLTSLYQKMQLVLQLYP